MKADFSIVLLRPEIPHNTGAIGRLCVGLGVPLHLVRPLGFALDDRYVARAGLDYWPHLDLMIHDTWEDYLASVKPRRVHFLSTHGEKSLYDCRFEAGDALVFGNESSGLPKDFYERYRESLSLRRTSRRTVYLLLNLPYEKARRFAQVVKIPIATRAGAASWKKTRFAAPEST